MVRLHEQNALNRTGKIVSSLLSYAIVHNHLSAKLTRLLETYLAFVQGKGSGAGWDLKSEIEVALAHIRRPDAIVFDIGANKGEWSQALLRALNNQCYIFQFEPSPKCREILRKINTERTTLIEAAVGERSGVAVLYSPIPGSPVASLYRRAESYLQSEQFIEEEVNVVTIDDILAENRIDVVDFIKIDTEGHDLAVLKGAQRSLDTKRIRALSFEFGSPNIYSRTYFRDFWELLSTSGYRIKRICPGGRLLTLEDYYEDLEYFRSVTNYLAIPE